MANFPFLCCEILNMKNAVSISRSARSIKCSVAARRKLQENELSTWGLFWNWSICSLKNIYLISMSESSDDTQLPQTWTQIKVLKYWKPGVKVPQASGQSYTYFCFGVHAIGHYCNQGRLLAVHLLMKWCEIRISFSTESRHHAWWTLLSLYL